MPAVTAAALFGLHQEWVRRFEGYHGRLRSRGDLFDDPSYAEASMQVGFTCLEEAKCVETRRRILRKGVIRYDDLQSYNIPTLTQSRL